MTVAATNRVAGPFAGNDAATAFPFTFKIFATSDIVVTKTDSVGTDVILTEGADYSVAMNGDQEVNPGGVVTYPLSGAPLATGSKLTVTSTVPSTQGVSLPNPGPYYPKVVETEFDKLTILVQQLTVLLNTSIRLPTSDGLTTVTLPTAAQRLGKILAFDTLTGNISLVSGASPLDPNIAGSTLTLTGLAWIKDRLYVGASSSPETANQARVPAFQMIGSNGTPSASNWSSIFNLRRSANNSAPHYILGKSRNPSPGGHTIVVDGDGLGTVDFCGDDGDEFIAGVTLIAEVDGAPANNSMPGRFIVKVTPTGGVTPVEALRVSQDKTVTAAGNVVVAGSLSVGGVPVTATVMQKYLTGLELSFNSTTVLNIAAGMATSSDNTTSMVGAAYTKSTSAWVVGTGNGALDTGAIGNNSWYHVFIIERTDTGVVDYLFSLSPSAPTMPASYTKKRRIGSFRTNGSAQITNFTQNGDTFSWLAPIADFYDASIGDALAHTLALTVPTGVVVEAILAGATSNASAAGSILYLSSLAQTDVAASPTSITANAISTTSAGSFVTRVLTDTSAQIRYRVQAAGQTTNINTQGWVDTRGK